MTLGTSLTVDLNDLHRMEARTSSLSDDTVPPEGSAVLSVDRFGLSTHNVTYADSATSLGYWSIFPAPDGTGTVPVWGHATVVRSGHPQLVSGATFYGLLPMATHLLVTPNDVGPRGFTDASTHRRSAAPVYNRYLDGSTDPVAQASPSSALEVVLRPTFTTSFLLESDLASNAWYGADAIVLTSASSRTAIGAAHVMQTRTQRPAIIGLTSGQHLTDVRELGCYDRVLDYDDVASLPVGPTALVDLTGDGPVVAALHRRLASSLTHSAVVGATHRHARPLDTTGLPGPPRTLFLAPGVATHLRDSLGDEVLERTLAAAWRGWTSSMQEWLRIHVADDVSAVRDMWRNALDGTASPRDAWVLTLRPTGT